MSTMFWIWMAAAIIFLILELVSPALFFICFVAGAAVAGVYSFFSPGDYYWQIGVFVVVTLGLLPLMRMLAKRISSPMTQRSNVDALIGKTALVTKAIDPDLGGLVLVEGETWRAGAEVHIEEKAKVSIVRVSGTKLFVEKV